MAVVRRWSRIGARTPTKMSGQLPKEKRTVVWVSGAVTLLGYLAGRILGWEARAVYAFALLCFLIGLLLGLLFKHRRFQFEGLLSEQFYELRGPRGAVASAHLRMVLKALRDLHNFTPWTLSVTPPDSDKVSLRYLGERYEPERANPREPQFIEIDPSQILYFPHRNLGQGAMISAPERIRRGQIIEIVRETTYEDLFLSDEEFIGKRPIFPIQKHVVRVSFEGCDAEGFCGRISDAARIERAQPLQASSLGSKTIVEWVVEDARPGEALWLSWRWK